MTYKSKELSTSLRLVNDRFKETCFFLKNPDHTDDLPDTMISIENHGILQL